MRRAVAGIGLSVSTLVALASCGGREHATERDGRAPAVAVRTVLARDAARDVGEEVVGTIRARQSATIAAEVTGAVRKLRVDVGDRVERGEVLIELSAAEIAAQVSQARAAFDRAEADRRRVHQLFEEDAVSRSQVDEADAQYRITRAALAEAGVMSDYTVLRAPFDGVITAKQADVGDLAMPGRPLLEMENPGEMRLEASVPETLVGAIGLGAELPVRIDALGRDLPATVSEVEPSADPSSRTVLAKLDLPEDPALRSGMFGRLAVKTGEGRVVTVPRSAVVQRGQIETLFVVSGGIANMRIVRTGPTRGEEVEILSGLAPGEEIVVSHPERLVDGQPVSMHP